MKLIALILGCVAVVSASSLALSQRAPEAETACSSTTGHADARDCLIRRAAHAASLVADAERTFKTVLSTSAEDPIEISRAVTAFERASQQYDRYRKDQCDFVAALALGGNGASDRRLLCQIELDNRRVADLAQELNRGV
jgi:uncharacterized protein YecT (DUF1311 family)